MPPLLLSTHPLLTINGLQAGFTCGLVIDHLARKVRGTVFIEAEDDALTLFLRTLRSRDRVQLEFVSVTEKRTVEYAGSAEAIMIRVRPRRNNVHGIIFAFRLLD